MTGPQQPPYGGQGGQWPAGGGEWQSPADQTQYSGPSDPGGPPAYEQPQQYDQYGQQPQQYDQYGQQPQPGYPDQYSSPPAPYAEPYSAPPGYDPNAPGMPPPPAKSGNATPWIIGGVAGVVVLVLIIVVGALLLNRGGGGGGGTPGGGGTTEAAGGKYSAANVENACDLIDTDAVKEWASKQDKEPDHSENKSDYSSYLSCSARYKGGDYDSASISLSATVGGKDSNMKDSYDSAVKSAKGSTGSGKENGEVSGIGEAAYFSSYVNDSEYSSSLIYDLTVLDDNALIRIGIHVFMGEPDGITKEDGEKVAKEQAQKALDGLKA
ncbi:MAG: hypothetical protein ACRDTM_09570 [Micromonosporaceae bacterium]